MAHDREALPPHSNGGAHLVGREETTKEKANNNSEVNETRASVSIAAVDDPDVASTLAALEEATLLAAVDLVTSNHPSQVPLRYTIISWGSYH